MFSTDIFSTGQKCNPTVTLQKIYADHTVNFMDMPFARALHDLTNGQADAVAFTFDSPGKGIYPAYPFLCARMMALCTSGHAVTSPKSLNGMRLIWRRGYSLQDRLPEGFWSYREIDTVKSGLNMLKAGRADCLIEERQVLELALKKLGTEIDKNGLSMTEPLIDRPVFLRFRDELQSLPLMEEFDRGMKRLLDSGQYARDWGEDQAACVRRFARPDI